MASNHIVEFNHPGVPRSLRPDDPVRAQEQPPPQRGDRGEHGEIARNGKEALAALARHEAAGTLPDLVLMDVMMPEMDGLAAMREMRRRPAGKKLPIIALTAKAMPEDRERCLEAGANDYIAKPIDVEKLLSLVRVWLPK
jgi:hypothetical protein